MERQYIVTERAHLMCPQMEFGLYITTKIPYDSERISEALEKLAAAHPFLRSAVGYEEETDRYFYNIGEKSRISLKEYPELSLDTVEKMRADYNEISGHDRDVMNCGLLNVFTYQTLDGLAALFVCHHLLTDGRGLLSLAQEFARYCKDRTEPEYSEERLISSREELPKRSGLGGAAAKIIGNANRKWLRENTRVSYQQYHEFAEKYCASHPVRHIAERISGGDYSAMRESCRIKHVTVNDWLMAKMYAEEKTRRIIIASDIRDRLPFYKKGALGNYSTAFSVKCRVGKKDAYTEAQRVHKKVRRTAKSDKKTMQVLSCYFAMEPGLLDAAAISALGGFESKTAKKTGKGIFGYGGKKGYSITNLGRIESEEIISAAFIPPASPAIKKTLGVVTVNEVMMICASETGR